MLVDDFSSKQSALEMNKPDYFARYFLIGSLHSTYLLTAPEGMEESAADQMNLYSDYECQVLGSVGLNEDNNELFLNLLSVNYGNLENPYRLANHPSLWDLFKLPLTAIERDYLHKRQMAYEFNFNAPYWANDRYMALPSCPVPYWSGDTLFPIFYGVLELAEVDEEDEDED